MKITAADVIVTCPGRTYVTLKITTEDGVVTPPPHTLSGRRAPTAAGVRRRKRVCG